MDTNKKNRFFIKTNGTDVTVEPVPSNFQTDHPVQLPINIKCEANKAKISVEGFDVFDEFCDDFRAEMMKLHTTEKNLNTVFHGFEQLILNYNILIKSMIPDHYAKEADYVISTASKCVVDKFKLQNTAKKRRSLIQKDECFVPSKAYGIGLAWSRKMRRVYKKTHYELLQTTYQYVSIIDTLKSLFKNSDFSQNFFEFNENRKHVCAEDIYENFCCGSIYKNKNVFTPTTIQLQLGIDEFEPCNALKTKSGLTN